MRGRALLRRLHARASVRPPMSLLIDTAGRLQNKAGLMPSWKKSCVFSRSKTLRHPTVTLLILDATTGQNALSQVEAFTAAVPLTGLVMTKLDGTAKGGILVALAAKFGIPVHFIGVGEREEDLQSFRRMFSPKH